MLNRIRRSLKKIVFTILTVVILLFLLSYFTEMRFKYLDSREPEVINRIEEKWERVRPDSESLKEGEVAAARQICDDRDWEWEDIRIHAYKGVITIWHPSQSGGSDSVTVDVTTGKTIAELQMEAKSEDGFERYKTKYYNSDGSAVETPYKGDIPHGTKREYYPNGAVYLETQFKEGKKHGRERIYDEKGVLTKETFWDNGVLR